MIAVIPNGQPGTRGPSGHIESTLCVVYLTERRGFAKVITEVYCGTDYQTGDGILQVSDSILEGKLISLPKQPPENKYKICPNCKVQIIALSK